MQRRFCIAQTHLIQVVIRLNMQIIRKSLDETRCSTIALKTFPMHNVGELFYALNSGSRYKQTAIKLTVTMDSCVPSAVRRGVELERLVSVVQRPLAGRMHLRQQLAMNRSLR